MFTIKIMSGPLFGLDLAFAAEKIFFSVGKAAPLAAENGLQEELANAGRHVIIPLVTDSPNFILDLADYDEAENEVFAEILDEEKSYAQTLIFNSVSQVGNLRLAIKHEADDWSLAVLEALAPTEAASTNMSQDGNSRADTSSTANRQAHLKKNDEKNSLIHSEKTNLATHSAFENKPSRVNAIALKSSLFIIIILLVILLVYNLKPNLFKLDGAKHHIEKDEVQPLAELFSHLPVYILNGRDQTQYIVAKRELDFYLAEKIIQSKKKLAQIKLIHLTAEQERIKKWLDTQGIAYFFVKAETANMWRIGISQERNVAPFNSAYLQQQLLNLLPYSQQVDIQMRSDDEAISAARQVAINAGLAADIIRTSQGVTVTIAGNIDDKQLIILRNALERFTQYWGQGYVQFVVQLNDKPRLSSFIL